MSPLLLRQKATDATLAKFGGKPFAWGSVDCGKLAAFHLRQLGRKVRLSQFGQYSSALSAVAALKRRGYANLHEALDGIGLPRIAPASMLTGDLIAFPADHPLGALALFVGNGNVAGFHELADSLAIYTPTKVALADATAWKAI